VIRAYDAAGNVIKEAISRRRKAFCSRHVALPAKMNFHESGFIGRSRE